MFQSAIDHMATWPASLSLADGDKADCPLIFVNRQFETLTGYALERTVGQNCRFLQSEETDPEEIARIREAVAARRAVESLLVNRKADGSRFHNFLVVLPIRTHGGRTLFIGAQHEFDDAEAVAEAHREADRAEGGFVRRRENAELLRVSLRMRAEAAQMLVQAYLVRDEALRR